MRLEITDVTDYAATIRGVYDSFLRGDIPAVMAAMHEQIEWNEAEHITYWPGAAFIGPHAVLTGVFARLPQDFDGFRVEVSRIVALGDTVPVEARYRATAKATGRPLDVHRSRTLICLTEVIRFQSTRDTVLCGGHRRYAEGARATRATRGTKNEEPRTKNEEPRTTCE
jgi:ketosteroid isomerase-like protein